MSVESVASITDEEPVSLSSVFTRALQGHPCAVVGLGAEPRPLPVDSWTRAADADDDALLAHCVGPTLDIGCGPGRLSVRLAQRGQAGLGIDVVHEAVLQARRRGASAIVRDVFESLPGEGRWPSALLADGNVGIGGDPVALLRRVRQVIEPGGRVVVELAAPGTRWHNARVTLHCDGRRSRPFRWSIVGTDAIAAVAVDAGLVIRTRAHAHGSRWCAVLGRP